MYVCMCGGRGEDSGKVGAVEAWGRNGREEAGEDYWHPGAFENTRLWENREGGSDQHGLDCGMAGSSPGAAGSSPARVQGGTVGAEGQINQDSRGLLSTKAAQLTTRASVGVVRVRGGFYSKPRNAGLPRPCELTGRRHITALRVTPEARRHWWPLALPPAGISRKTRSSRSGSTVIS